MKPSTTQKHNMYDRGGPNSCILCTSRRPPDLTSDFVGKTITATELPEVGGCTGVPGPSYRSSPPLMIMVTFIV